ncbi:MAG: hypothetical protein SFW08_14270 [Gemmatimonadaceae bacterium]|nr:hypothetical protein [Gemmatimonadaceae bacterium]
MPQALSPSVCRTFRVAARVMSPDAAPSTEDGWLECELLIARRLADLPANRRRQMLGFVRALPALAAALTGRRFARLSAVQVLALLHRLEASPVAALRRGVWGLRTLVFAGVYGRPETAIATGWRPHDGGWEGRAAERVRTTPGGSPSPLRLLP